MDATCATCSKTFEAKTRRAKYCSGACKKRAFDIKGRAPVVHLAAPTPTDEHRETTLPITESLVASFRAEDLATPLGQVALRLATDVDRLTPGLPGYATTVAQMRAAIDDLQKQSKPKVISPLVLLRERRAADRATG